jgi:serine/threonine protein kinase
VIQRVAMSSPDPRIGSQVAEYRVEGLIGRGGMGVVYSAEHIHLGKKVALKVLPPEYAADEEFRERFEREARLAASLEHPNIVPVTDAGEFDGELWIAMRLVHGQDLRALLEEHGPLNPIRAVSILGRVGSALDAAHARGLIHRDVKPGNILLEPPSGTRTVEHVYLTDFGLTKQVDVGAPEPGVPGSAGIGPGGPSHGLTRVGYFAGTVDYAAPEQFRGEALDGRVDVYALGCVLFECLTGRAPFVTDGEEATMIAHLSLPPPKASELRTGLPRGIDAVVVRAMAKDREARFPDCKAMIDAARSFLQGWDPNAALAASAPEPHGAAVSGTGEVSVPGPGSWSSSGPQSIPRPAASVPGPAPSLPGPASAPGTPPAASSPSGPVHPSGLGATGSGFAPPMGPPPGPPSRPSYRRRAVGGRAVRRLPTNDRTMLTWVLAGAAAAAALVILLILLSR